MKNSGIGIRSFFCVLVGLVIALLAPRAHAQYYPYSYLEAECPDTKTGAYATPQTSITGYSGSGYIRSNGDTTAANYNNTSADHATYRFITKSPDYYVVWLRVNTNNSANDDSLYINIDGATFPWLTLNNLPAASGWRWVSLPDAWYPLGVGEHTIEIANRENGLNIDKIAILSYTMSAPTGNGQQAYNCPVPVYFETECRGGAFAGYQLDKKTKTGFSGAGYIESASTNMDSNTRVDEATYFFESAAGAYKFFFRIHNNGSGSQDSWFYRVDNGAWITMNGTNGLGNAWGWWQGNNATLTHGVHTLQIRNRESGLSIDKIAFIPSAATNPSGSGAAAVNCEPYTKMSDWPQTQIDEYFDTHLNYIAANGPHALDHHVDWHLLNGPGGTFGAGSGTAFLGFHRAMVNDFRRFALETNSRSWLPINTVGYVLPGFLGDASDALQAVGLYETQYSPRANWSVQDYGMPSYLRLGGASDPAWPATLTLNGSTYTKLEDIPDLDTLGQAIAANIYHGRLHGDIGGTMDSFYSPADPIFFGWHGLIDNIATVWLTTVKGRAWAAANPSHRFLVPGFTDMHDWDNSDFAP